MNVASFFGTVVSIKFVFNKIDSLIAEERNEQVDSLNVDFNLIVNDIRTSCFGECLQDV